ncbi:MAG: PorP/SprF family type IX secretion system membrane protein, partial [Candidatus Pacearchaeota archaeon]|nr:PorP/SprF family type IX secretion system membrane protein [Candidatus Pacearchaeota archaeon]
MDLKSKIHFIEKILIIFVFVFSFHKSEGQQTPLNPLSYWIFTPHIYNPAIVGSKDFLSINLNAAVQGKSNTQIISGNARFSKTRYGYFSTPEIKEFKNIGIGGTVFNDIKGLSQNIGVSVAGSYHIPLNTRDLSFLSVGASVKGVYNMLDADTIEPMNPAKSTFYPNLDLGIYYFGTNLFAGLSTTNFLGNPEDPDSLGIFAVPVARQYYFTAGYKILLSRSLNIVLEPSVLINAYDSTFNKISDNINPILKLYLDNLCIGTYFLSDGNTSFFFQYRYSRFYIGAFYELPNKSPYFKRTPLVE